MASMFKSLKQIKEKVRRTMQFSGKCQSCRVPFGEYDVPKWVKTSSGSWQQLCKLCFKSMGGQARKNVLNGPSYNHNQTRLF